jgi:dTDP-4-amino-4,6-dideoxygalactose transaminase
MVEGRSMIPIAKPWMGEPELEAVRRTVLSGWVTQGPEVAAFERELAAYVGATHACAVSSCTTALHLALRAVEVGPGDEVITVSHSFIATANAIRYCGARPVFVDVDSETYNIEPGQVEQAISPRTRAILCVHQLGMPCDLTRLLAIARRHQIPLIEDAACAIGSEVLSQGSWEKVGKPHGDIACFSFHPRKLLTTGDGGMLTTANPLWDRQFRLWRQHGMSVPDTVRHSSAQVVFESYPVLGYNYRLTDLQAALGRAQLKRIPEVIARRRGLAERYRQGLKDIPGLGLPREPEWARSNWQSYCVRLPAWFDQRKVMQAMLDAGIATRRGVMCAHRECSYPRSAWSCLRGQESCDCPPLTCQRLAQGEHLQDSAIILPLFHEMTEDEQSRVVDCLARVVSSAARQP